MEKYKELEKEVFPIIKDYFLLDKKFERCGLLVKNKEKYTFFPCNNISKDKYKSFSIDPKDYLVAKSAGEMIACCHSHVKDASFSATDILRSFQHNISYILYNIKKDKFYLFDPKQYDKYKKYLNLDFRLGQNDCGNIIYNFFKNELKFSKDIVMPDFTGIQEYKDLKNKNLHLWDKDIYKNNMIYFDTFKPKSFEDLQINDIIIFNDFEKQPIHAAIYIGEELILHQTVGSPSKIEGLRKAHIKFIDYVARLK